METIFVLVIATIFMIVGMYYFPWIIFLYPILFILLGVRQGLNLAIIGLILSTLSIGLIVDIISGIVILITFAPLSITIIYTLKKRKSSTEILAVSTLVFLLSVLLIIVMMNDITGVNIISLLTNIINQLKEAFDQSIDNQIEILYELKLSNYQILQIKDLIEDTFQYILTITPSMIIVFSLITAYLNYLISSLSLRKLGYGIVFIPRFSRFKLPRNILVGIGIMFLVTFSLSYLGMHHSEAVLVNLIVLAFFVFFTQGLSVAYYKLAQWKVNKITRMFIVLFIIILSSVLGGIITIIGVLDTILDFRRFRRSV